MGDAILWVLNSKGKDCILSEGKSTTMRRRRLRLILRIYKLPLSIPRVDIVATSIVYALALEPLL